MSFNRLQSLPTKYLNAHIADEVKHITAAERTSWNGKLDASEFTGHTHSKLVNSGFDLVAPALTAGSTISIVGHKHEIADVNGLAEKLTCVFRWKGSCTWAELQAKTDMEVGDVWCVTDRDYAEYCWNGTSWERLGINVDTTKFIDRVAGATVGNFPVFVAGNTHGLGIADSGYAPLTSYVAGGTANTKVVMESALAGAVSTLSTAIDGKISKVATDKTGEFLTATATGEASPNGYTLGVTSKTNYGAANKIATEIGTKDYVGNAAATAQATAESNIKAIIGGTYSTTATVDASIQANAGNIATNTAAIATLNGDATTAGSVAKQVKDGDDAVKAIIGGTFSSSATVASAITALNTAVDGKMAKVTGDTAGKVLVSTADNNASASSYVIGGTVSSGFGTAGNLATEQGAKAYADAGLSTKLGKGTVDGTTNAEEIMIVGGTGTSPDAVASGKKLGGAAFTANEGAYSENLIATEKGAAAYADGAATTAKNAVIAIIGGTYTSTATVDSAIQANTTAITTLNGDSSTTGSVAKQVKDGDDAVKAIIGGTFSSSATVASKISSLEDEIEGLAAKKQHTAEIAGATVAAADLESILVSGGMQHQIVCSAATTITLPTTAATFAGRSANVDVIIGAGSYNVTVTDGTQSEVFAADSEKTMLISFKTVMTGATTFGWRLFE